MKKIMLPLLALSALFISGCVVSSIYPFYTEKNLTFDPALVGQWVEKDGNDENAVWVFSNTGENEYLLSIPETDGQTEIISVHLFKLGGKRFMDWVEVEWSDGGIPPHYLFRVRQISPTLQIEPMSEAWLEKLVAINPRAVRHIVLKDNRKDSTNERIVLTADTKELQKIRPEIHGRPSGV